MMSNDFTTIYILSSKIEFDVEVVHKITDDTIHKLHEVATIPRASQLAEVIMISITSGTIDICKILLDTMDNWAGGTVLFKGSVRDHNEDGTVSEIYYEAYKEMAEKKSD